MPEGPPSYFNFCRVRPGPPETNLSTAETGTDRPPPLGSGFGPGTICVLQVALLAVLVWLSLAEHERTEP